MGACCTSSVDGQKNSNINELLKQAKQSHAGAINVLLLGPGGSGKSTLFKQIHRINTNEYPFDEDDRKEARAAIRLNLVKNILKLLKVSQVFASQNNNNQFNINYENIDEMDLPPEWETFHSNERKQQSNDMLDGRRNLYTINNDENQIAENVNNIDNNIIIFQNKEEFCNQLKSAMETLLEFGENSIKIKEWDDYDKGIITENIKLTQNGMDDIFDEEEHLGKYIAILWKLPAIQLAFQQRFGRFSFPDNLDFFFNRAQEIFESDYLPNDEHVLKVRIRTTGILSKEFAVLGFSMQRNRVQTLKIIDVGGQRCERRKWIKCFEDVNATIFVAALNHYATVLFEQESKNAMHEALELFEEIVKGKWFRKTPIVLFLNKSDLFANCIFSGYSLRECFDGKQGTWYSHNHPESVWNGPQIDWNLTDDKFIESLMLLHASAIQFIVERFLFIAESYRRVRDRDLYLHITCATRSDNVEKVYQSVLHHVILNNLVQSGLMPMVSNNTSMSFESHPSYGSSSSRRESHNNMHNASYNPNAIQPTPISTQANDIHNSNENDSNKNQSNKNNNNNGNEAEESRTITNTANNPFVAMGDVSPQRHESEDALINNEQ